LIDPAFETGYGAAELFGCAVIHSPIEGTMLTAALRTQIWFSGIAALLLVFGPATLIRSGEDVGVPSSRYDAAPATAAECESADQVANEILQLRKSIGPAWRGDAIADSSQTATDDRETIRTALVAQASSPMERPPLQPQADFGMKRTLREAAHQLDLTAHALECQELCSQADDVRALAQRFRQQARDEPVPVLRFNGKHFTPVTGSPAD
jgi:hypothetical protein